MSRKKLIITACFIIAIVAAIGILRTPNDNSSESLALASKKQSDYSTLVGRWTRQTGGYEISINKISDNGQAYAEYFNPRPIHVSMAEVSEQKGTLNLFIELRDKGYPGSTYTLKYNPDYDALVGVYFQAAMQQSFDVAFVRKK